MFSLTAVPPDGSDNRAILEQAVAPFYGIDGVSRLLDRSPEKVIDTCNTLGLLMLRTGDGTAVFPAWQFTADNIVIPRLPEVLAVLADGSSDAWTWALRLTAIDDDLGQKSASQWLADDGDPQWVLREAAADATRWKT